MPTRSGTDYHVTGTPGRGGKRAKAVDKEPTPRAKRVRTQKSERKARKADERPTTTTTTTATAGRLMTFGDQIAGELGPRERLVDGVRVRPNEPSVVRGVEEAVTDVACGAMHTLVVRARDGDVISFGCNDDHALGRPTLDDAGDADEEKAGAPHALGLSAVVRVTAGDMHSAALTADGHVWVWGNFKDESRKLGVERDALAADGDDFEAARTPQRVPLDAKVVDIASGCHHVLLLTDSGHVFSFGEGSKGQLGRVPRDRLAAVAEQRDLFLVPARVPFPADVRVERVWASHWSSYARATTGQLYGWGLNNFFQLGFRSSELLVLEPTPSPHLADVVALANGQHHMIAADGGGRVWACGNYTYGKLGLGDLEDDVDVPRPIDARHFAGESVAFVACGDFCSFALTAGGRLYAWGQGSKHVGSEEWRDLNTPTLFSGHSARDTQFVRVSAGTQHTAVVGRRAPTAANGK